MNFPAITTHSAVTRARALLRAYDPDTLQEQLRIASIPAPSGAEDERGAYLRSRFLELELEDVHTDPVGNVLARLPDGGCGDPGTGAVLLAAHLDTVFPVGTDVSPRVEGERILAPGITDNARGLAALVTLARVMRECVIRTRRPVWLVATVGEEGIGDLRGVKHLFQAASPFAHAAAFISLDGSGTRRIVHRAIGARRLRARIEGPGGHSWSDFGLPNPIHALGAGIARLREIELPAHPPATLTVARLGGGTSVNAIPSEAWLEVDIRSESGEALAGVEREVRMRLGDVVEEESTRTGGDVGLVLSLEIIGDRPCGALPAEHPLVQAAVRATRYVDCAPELVASSTDANVPISLGIPAITIGAGGVAGGVHTRWEWFENRGGARGLERALLTVLAAAGLA